MLASPITIHINTANRNNIIYTNNNNAHPPIEIISIESSQALAAADENKHQQVIATKGGLQRKGRLMDLAGVIDPQSANQILEEIESVEISTGTELQILIVDDIDTQYYQTTKQFATMIFNEWHIGGPTTKKNNGVLVAVALQQRRVEIEIGKGLNPYMNSDWCTELLEREMIPSIIIQDEHHGQPPNYSQGLYKAVHGIANRLRQIDNDGAVPTSMGAQLLSYQEKKQSFLQTIAVGLVGLMGLVGIFVSQDMYESKYPMGKGVTCSQCGSSTKWVASSKYFDVIKDATDEETGLERKKCTCSNCGNTEFATKTIPMYDGRTYNSDDGSYTYYRASSSSGSSDGGGGGGSSDGGGGGASW